MIYKVNICIFLLLIANVHTWSIWDIGNVIIDNTACKFQECCNAYYIPQDMNGMYKNVEHLYILNKLLGPFLMEKQIQKTKRNATNLQNNKSNIKKWNKLSLHGIFALRQKLYVYLYGQHIVEEILINGLHDHIALDNPQKALAISFHGAPGIGKNYVTKFIVESFYKKGFNSKYVHFYYGPSRFPEKDMVKTYQRELYNEIRGALKNCPKQIFIFDEIDKMPRGVLDALKVFLDTNKFIGGVDIRHAIFIFILNTGGKDIVEIYEAKRNAGLHREQLKLYHFERSLFLESFNKAGGFLFADIVESHLIDHYIPFLPLDRKHVELCIRDEFNLRNVYTPTEAQIKEIMEYVDFDGQFAAAGCKRISAKVGAVIRRSSRSHSTRDSNEL